MGSRRTAPRGRAARVVGALLTCAFAIPAAAAQPPRAPETTLFRVFLRDGGVLVSYGEFAQVADRVVLSVPVGGPDDNPVLHVLTVGQQDVDWERTNAYTRAVRAKHFAETRGEAEFAKLSHEVADMLNRIAFVGDAAVRLSLAESARRRLLEWPQQHYGYRADDVAQMGVWLDQVVSELRIAAGRSSFDLALVAGAPAGARPVQILPPPTPRERIASALDAARRAEASQRVPLLQAVLEALTPPADGSNGDAADETWRAVARARASAELRAELAVERRYAELTAATLEQADRHAQRADVRGLQLLVQSVLEADRALAGARPAEVSALLATLDSRIDQARRLRLARDAWSARAALIARYWRDVRQGLDRLIGVRRWLEDVRELAGPAPRSTRRLADLAALAERELSQVAPPPEVASPHAGLRSAAGLAARAGSMRLEAIRSGSMDPAWQASSAAAGSLMLMDGAIEELRRLTKAPRP